MKKTCITLFLLVCFVTTATAFTFPEPDWGALLKEKERMVKETELSLYTEASVDSAPYYGARFEPRGGTYLGMIAETSENYQPLGSYLTYIEDMGQADLYYPANDMITEDAVLPMVGWTIHDIHTIDFGIVRNVLATLNGYNKPMLVRFANEMNVSALGNDPDAYIRAFRTVADMIHEYPNLGVVWSPNDLGALDRPFEYFYPGDEYVDWIGISCYSIKYFAGQQNTQYKDSVYFMTGDFAWATNRVKPIMEFLEKNNIQKPVMISEGGVATSNSFGDALEGWSVPRLKNMLYYLVMKYPQIKMINYFNTYRTNELEKFDLNSQTVQDVFKEATASGAYIRKANTAPEFVYQPAEYGETLVAKDGIVRLYTLAHFPGHHDISVNYSLDGNWYRASNQIPYTCRMDMADVTDGKHTLTVSTLGESKNYTFYKTGNCIRFGSEPDPEIVAQNEVKITVTLNGASISFDQPPVMKNDRTLVPLRAIFEALNATVDWDSETKTAKATKGSTAISLQIGSNELYVNGAVKILDVPAELIGGRTLVPARAISESLGCKVDWDGETKTVIVTT